MLVLVQKCKSVQFTAEEETARDAEIEAYADKSAERKLNVIKQIRLEKLMETDYIALTEVTLTAEMTTYRQALRDITSHSNWPNLSDSDWPTKP